MCPQAVLLVLHSGWDKHRRYPSRLWRRETTETSEVQHPDDAKKSLKQQAALPPHGMIMMLAQLGCCKWVLMRLASGLNNIHANGSRFTENSTLEHNLYIQCLSLYFWTSTGLWLGWFTLSQNWNEKVHQHEAEKCILGVKGYKFLLTGGKFKLTFIPVAKLRKSSATVPNRARGEVQCAHHDEGCFVLHSTNQEVVYCCCFHIKPSICSFTSTLHLINLWSILWSAQKHKETVCLRLGLSFQLLCLPQSTLTLGLSYAL